MLDFLFLILCNRERHYFAVVNAILSLISSERMWFNLLLIRYALYESVQILKIYYKIPQSGEQ